MIFMKKNFSALSIRVLAILLIPAFCFGYFSKGNEGLEAFSFVSTFDSPRNAALETSNGAFPSSDPTITQLNIALLRLPENKNYVAETHWQTGDLAENQGTFNFTGHYKEYLFQISYNWLDYGSIDGYNEFGEATGKEYNPFSQLITAAMAFPMKHIQFGVGLKVVTDKLADEDLYGDRTAIGAAFDWGLSWQASSKIFGIAISAKDFGYMLQDYSDDDVDEYYTLSQTFSLAGYLRPKSIRRLTMFTSTDIPRYSEPVFHVGAEYIIGNSFFVRGGFTRSWLDITRDFKELAASSDRPDVTNEAHFLSAGLGYTNNLFSLDYAFSYLAEGLGTEHRFGLRVAF